MPRIVVTIPTFNESQNIGLLLEAIHTLAIDGLETLVIDDQSPDGTADIVRAYQHKDPRCHLLVRTTERGRGTAGIAGFQRALELGADFAFEMDADFSHHPRYLPTMVERLTSGEADIVVGSRYVAGGADFDRGLHRRLISELARRYTKLMLRVTSADVTSGYRGFSRRILEACELHTCRSRGPSIVLELLFRASRKGARIAEVPIEFTDRVRGESTLTWKILVQSLLFVLELRIRGW